MLLPHCLFQLAASAALWGFAGPGVSSRRCLSLLEVIEGLGQAGSVRQDVEVVVQRVYSVPVSGVSSMSALRARGPPRSSSSPPAEKGRSRYCCNSSQGAQQGLSLVTKQWENKSFFYLKRRGSLSSSKSLHLCKQMTCSSSGSQASQAPPWWHILRLSGRPIVPLRRSPQSACTVSRHMALFDKGHKHSLINSSRSASSSSQFSGKTT